MNAKLNYVLIIGKFCLNVTKRIENSGGGAGDLFMKIILYTILKFGFKMADTGFYFKHI